MYTPSGSVCYLFLIIIYLYSSSAAAVLERISVAKTNCSILTAEKNIFSLANNGVSQLDTKSQQHGFRYRLNSA